MKVTFKKLRRYMEKSQANNYIPGRQAQHNLIDTLRHWYHKTDINGTASAAAHN